MNSLDHYTEATAIAQAPTGDDDSAIQLRARMILAEAVSLRREFDAAEAEYGEILDTARDSLGEEHRLVASLTRSLGWMHYRRAVATSGDERRDELQEAVRHLRDALARFRALSGDESFSTLSTNGQLAEALYQAGYGPRLQHSASRCSVSRRSVSGTITI